MTLFARFVFWGGPRAAFFAARFHPFNPEFQSHPGAGRPCRGGRRGGMEMKRMICLVGTALLLAGAAWLLPAAGNTDGGSAEVSPALSVEIHHCDT